MQRAAEPLSARIGSAAYTVYGERALEKSQLDLSLTLYTDLLKVQTQFNIKCRDTLFVRDQSIFCTSEIQNISIAIEQPFSFSSVDAKNRNAGQLYSPPGSATGFAEKRK